jgi:aspartyl-tRNA(Asn)/glutamyl-tRNA(Gln) amidotransferase subunit B
LPDQRKKRYIDEFKLSNYDSSILTAEKDISDFFDLVLFTHKELRSSAKLVVNWITSELFSILNKNEISISQSPISADYLGKLVLMITANTISGKIAKDVFEEMFISNKSPADIVKEKGLTQVTNINEIELIINEILEANKDKVGDYKSGKTKLLGYFVGQAMKLSKGKANPKILNDLLLEKLS